MVMDKLEHNGIKNVSRSNIECIKYKHNHTWISDQYFTDETFYKYKQKLTPEIVHRICKSLVNNNGVMQDALKDLHHEEIFNVTVGEINAIKGKRIHKNISDKYFTKDQFDRFRQKISSDVVRKICEYLCRFNGSCKLTLKQLEIDGIHNVTKHNIFDIKNKRNHRLISDEYFSKDRW